MQSETLLQRVFAGQGHSVACFTFFGNAYGIGARFVRGYHTLGRARSNWDISETSETFTKVPSDLQVIMFQICFRFTKGPGQI